MRVLGLSNAILCVCIIITCRDATAASLAVEQDVAGELVLAATVASDTLSDLARAYDQGYIEMRRANPTIDPWLTWRRHRNRRPQSLCFTAGRA